MIEIFPCSVYRYRQHTEIIGPRRNSFSDHSGRVKSGTIQWYPDSMDYWQSSDCKLPALPFNGPLKVNFGEVELWTRTRPVSVFAKQILVGFQCFRSVHSACSCAYSLVRSPCPGTGQRNQFAAWNRLHIKTRIVVLIVSCYSLW